MEYSSLPYDILYHICKTVAYYDEAAIRALSLVNKTTRACCIPILFQSIAHKQLRMPKYEVPSTLVDELAALQRNASITRVIKRIHLHLLWNHSHQEKGEGEEHPSVTILRAFFDFIFSMKPLEELRVHLPTPFLEPFKSMWPQYLNGASASTQQLLPALNSLALPSASWLFVTKAFPRLIRLETMAWGPAFECKPFFKDIGEAYPQLQEFECYDSPERGVINAIADSMPNLVRLGLYGDIKSGRSGWELDLCPLGRLGKLTTLLLPAIVNINIASPRYEPFTSSHAEHEAIGGPVIQAIEERVLTVPGHPLSRVIFGSIWGEGQPMWENVNGRLVRTKVIVSLGRTRKIHTITNVL